MPWAEPTWLPFADPMANAVLAVAVTVLVAFLVGSVNPATILARALGKDLQGSGSGNPGATNAGRVLGAKWGVLVGVLDVLKGLVPALVAGRLLGLAEFGYLAGLFAVIGHVWSPFLRGRGGKGVATAFGAVLGVHPVLALVAAVVFLTVAVGFKWMAGGSMAAAIALVVVGVLVGIDVVNPGNRYTMLWLFGLAAIILWRHRSNLKARWRALRLARDPNA